MKLNDNARDLLDRYLGRLRASLATRVDLDVREIESDVREHVREALHDHREPVGAGTMERVLEAMGNPVDWISEQTISDSTVETQYAHTSTRSAPRRSRDDWHLAYVSLALLLLAFALPPFLWIGVFGAFLAARASLSASSCESLVSPSRMSSGDDARRSAQHWLRNPSLLLVYVPSMMLLLLWPAIALRLAADFVVDHPEFALRIPTEYAWLAERIAQIRLSNFDPALALDNAVRTGHWLLFPVGCWLLVLAVFVAIAPRTIGRAFRPFFARGGRTIAGTLAFCGALLAGAAVALALLKHTIASGNLV